MRTISLFSTRLIDAAPFLEEILFKGCNYSKSANYELADYFGIDPDINNSRCVLYKLNENFGQNIFAVHIIEQRPAHAKCSWINFLVKMLREELHIPAEETAQINLFLHSADIKGEHIGFDDYLYSHCKENRTALAALCDGELPKNTELNVAFFHHTANDIVEILANDEERDINEEIQSYIEDNI